ncbi:hypothetical protein TNCT_277561 [Trichonephila clavata]|uniref:Uncharacterized protein n=1 Tax=Trichonephila clavata TaxID=2740835 RepID=A0A8X6KTI5_TRICU|nr:hypothetical protein TNCT_277561 [Trichonephila clavata]
MLFPREERVKLCENFTSLNLLGDNWVSRAGCLWKSPFLTLSDIECKFWDPKCWNKLSIYVLSPTWGKFYEILDRQKQMFPKPCCNEVERTRHQVKAKILRRDGSRNNYSAKSKAKREGERGILESLPLVLSVDLSPNK